MSKEKVKESTENYIDVVLKQHEEQAGVAMTEALVNSTVFTDKLSSSLLIVSGAAITLGIGNSKAVISALGSGSFKALIISLLIASIAGFGAKACHAISLMYMNLSKDLIAKMTDIFDKYDSFETKQIEGVKDIIAIEQRRPDKERIFSVFIDTLPIFIQKSATNRIKNGSSGTNTAQRNSSTAAFIHVFLFGFQTILVIIAFSAAIFGVE